MRKLPWKVNTTQCSPSLVNGTISLITMRTTANKHYFQVGYSDSICCYRKLCRGIGALRETGGKREPVLAENKVKNYTTMDCRKFHIPEWFGGFRQRPWYIGYFLWAPDRIQLRSRWERIYQPADFSGGNSFDQPPESGRIPEGFPGGCGSRYFL